MSRACVNSANKFCYICGEIVLKHLRRNITKPIEEACKQYFKCKLGDQDKDWAPHVVCNRCATCLLRWMKNGKNKMPFDVPMVWREPTDHATDCYFCLSNTSGYTNKSKKTPVYSNVPSALRPVQSEDQSDATFPVAATFPDAVSLPIATTSAEIVNSDENRFDHADTDFLLDDRMHLMDQKDLDDLVRDLNLSKTKAEILASRLQQWNLLTPETHVTHFRTRNKELQKCFLLSENLCYCHNVNSLIDKLGFEHRPKEWRLFIDSSKKSFPLTKVEAEFVVPPAY